MSVIHYISEKGVWHREIKSKSFKALSDLKLAYEVKGNRTWISLWDAQKGIWGLTVVLS